MATESVESCPYCGKILDDEGDSWDDVTSGKYITHQDEVTCIPCGRRIDREHQDRLEDKGKTGGR